MSDLLELALHVIVSCPAWVLGPELEPSASVLAEPVPEQMCLGTFCNLSEIRFKWELETGFQR